jgi:molybdenum cofactor synthesis domain-containing protein
MDYTAAVLTVSDSAAQAKREDLSGPAVRAALEVKGYRVVTTELVRDDQSGIEVSLMQLCDKAQLVVTTGGTGIAERDVTPEATRRVADKIVDGIGERMRLEGALKTPYAVLSRGICAVRGRSVILNLPGSPTAATESLAAVIDILPHALDLLAGNTSHAGHH